MATLNTEQLEFQEYARRWLDENRPPPPIAALVVSQNIRSLTPDTPDHWSALVEESFPIEALEDPMVFFDAKTQQELEMNRKRMVESCARFLDFDSLEVTFVSEFWYG